MEAPPKRNHWPSIAFVVGFALLMVVQTFVLKPVTPQTVRYDELLSLVASGQLSEVEIGEEQIVGIKKPSQKDGQRAPKTAPKPEQAQRVATSRIPDHDDAQLIALLEQKNIPFRGRVESAAWWEPFLFGWVLPLTLLLGLWSLASRRMNRRGGPLSFGRSRVKIYDRAITERVTFDDVAGVDEAEAELVEVVDFLENPQKYQALGARIPKGVLLLGPPGTGKTLLARAVAGEAGVPFFSMSGSDFVEMFVGVGAARIRDLFEQAKERAPCIVFIDELDAIGKSRGGLTSMSTNDEREQTLNQLLVEMDGFDASSGVVIMAATNRPEILDPALVRSGRFDRQVLVDRPDVRGRQEILKVHARKVRLDRSVDLHLIAQRTPGMVGADLANLINEAALHAARREALLVEQGDLEEAIDRIQFGFKKQNRAMRDEEKRRVAFHESGHALVALTMKHADPVHRVTIIPRSIGALGATLQLPTEDRYLMTREELADRLCVMLGGRAAEELVFENLSTGAQNDLERVTETARQMVCRFGMSDRLGPVTYGRPVGMHYLEAPVSFGEERNFSEQTARTIDEEVRELIDAEYARAQEVVKRRRNALDAIAFRLLEVETLERNELERLAALDGSPRGQLSTLPPH